MHIPIRPVVVALTAWGFLAALAPALAQAQDPLSLDEAIARALKQNPAVRAAAAGVQEAQARADQARSGWFPRLDISEGFQRGNQPVFVFGSLLAQRSFGPENFAIDALNNPAPISNFRTAITAEQLVFDGGRRESAVRQAHLGEQLATTTGADVGRSLRVAATERYGQVLMAMAQRRAADAALQSADEDLRRAERRRDAGLGTEADVLAVRVHQARMRERLISSTSQETIARALLNDVMGEPLDRVFVLQLPRLAAEATPEISQVETDAMTLRADVIQARLQASLAREGRTTSRAAFFPQVGVQGGLEFNGATFLDQSQSWNVGAFVRWNLFSGLGDAARLRETTAAQARADADRERVESAVKVEVRTAMVRVDDARAREAVGRSARQQAAESQRIIRDRYDAGLASVNDVLRAAEAVLQTELQYTTAAVDVIVSAAMLDRARGK